MQSSEEKMTQIYEQVPTSIEKLAGKNITIRRW